MSFSDHKITQFTHRISELADQPNMPADELKARFDSSPEELRESVNGICDDADRLEARVEGIVNQTFADTITKAMLSSELRSELDAKAVETSVASRINSEKNSRTSADTALSNRISALESAMPLRVRAVCGTYAGDGTDDRFIALPFEPLLVITGVQRSGQGIGFLLKTIDMIFANSGYSPYPSSLESSGFRVHVSHYVVGYSTNLNQTNKNYAYLAFGI